MYFPLVLCRNERMIVFKASQQKKKMNGFVLQKKKRKLNIMRENKY